MKNKNIIIAVGIVVLLAATIGYYTSRQINNPETEIRSLVTEFGTKLWMVPFPSSIFPVLVLEPSPSPQATLGKYRGRSYL